MKLAATVVASTAVLFGIAACSSGPDASIEDDENTGSTSQAICFGIKCTTLGGGGWNVGGSSGVLDPGRNPPQTFTCSGKIICPPHNSITWGYLTLSCNPNDPEDCVCADPCIPGGGGWPNGSYNPCVAGTRYTCTSYGYCTCR